MLPALAQRRGFIILKTAPAVFAVCDLEGGGSTKLAMLERPEWHSAEQCQSCLTHGKISLSQCPSDTGTRDPLFVPALPCWGVSALQLCSDSSRCHSHGTSLVLMRSSTSLLPFGYITFLLLCCAAHPGSKMLAALPTASPSRPSLFAVIQATVRTTTSGCPDCQGWFRTCWELKQHYRKGHSWCLLQRKVFFPTVIYLVRGGERTSCF